MQNQSLVIDCDPGIDDALALLLAAASPTLQLLGVTSVAGNRPLETTTLNARRILDLAGRLDVPVYAGCARPLARPDPRCNLVHGEDGLGGAVLPPERGPLDQLHAVDFLERVLLLSEPRSLTLVAIGPLTNLAMAEIKRPGLLRRAGSLLIMGGAVFCKGNVTPAAEFNFHCDALAARVVLQSGAPITLFGLDVTSKVLMSADWIQSFDRGGNSASSAVAAMLRAYAVEDPLLHDACPVAYALDPTLFRGKPCRLAVDWIPGPNEGRVFPLEADEGEDALAPSNTELILDVDAERLLRLVHERIMTLAY